MHQTINGPAIADHQLLAFERNSTDDCLFIVLGASHDGEELWPVGVFRDEAVANLLEHALKIDYHYFHTTVYHRPITGDGEVHPLLKHYVVTGDSQ